MRFARVLLIPSLAVAAVSLSWLSSSRSESKDALDAPGILSPDSVKAAMFANSPPGAPLLSDIIGLKQCTIMSDYTLSLKEVAQRLADPSRKTLVLAPLNSAIMALPSKPWVDGTGSGQDPKISPQRNDESASKNIEAFVKHHIVAQYPLEAGQKAETLAGEPVYVEIRAGEKYVNGKFKVVSEKKADNGAIWVISGVLTAASHDTAKHEGL